MFSLHLFDSSRRTSPQPLRHRQMIPLLTRLDLIPFLQSVFVLDSLKSETNYH